MKNAEIPPNVGRLVLAAETAADLMTKDPIMVRDDLTIRGAATFLIAEEISAAPVIDGGGCVVGVVSHTDIVRHDSDGSHGSGPDAAYYYDLQLRCPPALRELVHGMKSDVVRVRDVMSPVVFKVSARDSAVTVVAEFLALKVHRLFVVDDSAKLVGVISALDVMRHLNRQQVHS